MRYFSFRPKERVCRCSRAVSLSSREPRVIFKTVQSEFQSRIHVRRTKTDMLDRISKIQTQKQLKNSKSRPANERPQTIATMGSHRKYANMKLVQWLPLQSGSHLWQSILKIYHVAVKSIALRTHPSVSSKEPLLKISVSWFWVSFELKANGRVLSIARISFSKKTWKR